MFILSNLICREIYIKASGVCILTLLRMTKCTVPLAATYPPLSIQDLQSLTSSAAFIKSIYELQVAGTSDKLLHELLVTASCAYSQEIQLEIKLHVK